MVMTNLLRSPGEGRVPGASNGLRLPAFQAIQHLLPAGPLGRKQDPCHAPVGVPHEISLLLCTKKYSSVLDGSCCCLFGTEKKRKHQGTIELVKQVGIHTLVESGEIV